MRTLKRSQRNLNIWADL